MVSYRKFMLSCSNDTEFFVFFFNDTATTEIYTLSLHDALPIFFRLTEEPQTFRSVDLCEDRPENFDLDVFVGQEVERIVVALDRKSTRLNSSHANISYAVFCLKKKKKNSIKYHE